jgi:HlyD family secretion protein
MLPSPMTTRLSFPMTMVLAASLALVAGMPRANGQPPAAPKAAPDALERFRQADPAERKALLDKLPDLDRLYHKVGRGDVVSSLMERGTLEAVQFAEVHCKLKDKAGSTYASTIKWVVEEGTAVRKGDLLVDLDDSGLKEQVEASHRAINRQQDRLVRAEHGRKIVLAKNAAVALSARNAVELAELNLAQADRKMADETKACEIRVRQAQLAVEKAKSWVADKKPQAQTDLEIAEGNLELAQIEQKRSKDAATLNKRRLELAVQEAKAAVEVATLQAKANLDPADEEVVAQKSLLEKEQTRLADLMNEFALCKIRSPQDGLVTYYVPEQTRFGGGQPIIAQGEPVREGQKLLRVSDLGQMRVAVRVPEALVSRIRKLQPAEIRVDASPNRLLNGKIQEIATVASARDWMARDTKVYPTTVQIDGENKGGVLKPGMSALVTVVLELRLNVPRLPATAILWENRQAFCYVKSGDKIELRKLTLGLNGTPFAEIKEGVEEGEMVLADPHAALAPDAKNGQKPLRR